MIHQVIYRDDNVTEKVFQFNSKIILYLPSCILSFVEKCKFFNCGIRHVTVPIATRILIANVRHIGLSNICVINLVYFKMQV